MSLLIRTLRAVNVKVISRNCLDWLGQSRRPFIRSIGSKEFNRKRVSLMLFDKVPAGYELIYRAPMETYIKVTKNISTLTALLVSIGAIYAISSAKFVSTPSFEISGLITLEEDLWYFASGFIFITVVIRLFIAKYPVRIYRKTDSYIAVYDSGLLLQPFKHYFQKGEVRKLHNNFNPWNESTYQLGTKSSLILSSYFKTPFEYNNMLGYD